MINVGIYIYDDAEVLDFSGPFEVFTTATRVSGKEPFNTFLVNEDNKVVTARAGYKVIPDYHFNNHPTIDVLIVVGGDHTDEVNKVAVIRWISQQGKDAQLVASVCTGAFLLAKAKVITTHNVTTHWEDISDLQAEYPALKVKENKRWVSDESVITSGGISAGIDMSLYLVSKLMSHSLALATAKQMEFDWKQNSTG